MVRLLQLLQSVDEDNDSSNGIKIPTDVKTKFTTNHTDLSSDSTSDIDITTLVQSVNRSVVSVSAAQSHYSDTLNHYNIPRDTTAPDIPELEFIELDQWVKVKGEAQSIIVIDGVPTQFTLNSDGKANIVLEAGVHNIALMDVVGNIGGSNSVVVVDSMAPVFTNITDSTEFEVNINEVFSYTIIATGVTGITYSLENSFSQASIGSSSGVLEILSYNSIGVETLTIVATDDNGNFSSRHFPNSPKSNRLKTKANSLPRCS
jgi:hypothetical protein